MYRANSPLSFLDRLRRFSRISADTSDYAASAGFSPDDLTTNPSLLLQFLNLETEVSQRFVTRAVKDTYSCFSDEKLKMKEILKENIKQEELPVKSYDDLRFYIVPIDEKIGRDEPKKEIRSYRSLKVLSTTDQGNLFSLSISSCKCLGFSPKDHPLLTVIALDSSDVEKEDAFIKELENAENKAFLWQIADRFAALVAVDVLGNISGNVSVEVPPRLSDKVEETVLYAEDLMKLLRIYAKELKVDCRRVYVKIPATYEGIKAAEILENDQNIRCNLTLIFSFVQALCCMQAGVSVISPFVGRLTQWHKDHNDGVGALEIMANMLQQQEDCAQYFLNENRKRALEDDFNEEKVRLFDEEVQQEVSQWKNEEEVLDILRESGFADVDLFIKRLKDWQNQAKKSIFSLDEASIGGLLSLQSVESQHFLYSKMKSFDMHRERAIREKVTIKTVEKATIKTAYFPNLQRLILGVNWLCRHTLKELKQLFFLSRDPGLSLVLRCCCVAKKGKYTRTSVLAASFRSLEQIIALAGVPIITISLDFLDQLKKEAAGEDFWENVHNFDHLFPEEPLLDRVQEEVVGSGGYGLYVRKYPYYYERVNHNYSREDFYEKTRREKNEVIETIFALEMAKDAPASALLRDGIQRFADDYQTFIDKVRVLKKDILKK